MRATSIGVGHAILATIAAAAALTTAACTSCPTSETVRNDPKAIETARICDALLARTNTATSEGCAAFCGEGYTSCQIDPAYTAVYFDADAGTDAGAPACPASPDGKPTVKVACLETRYSSELTAGGCVVEGRRPERLAAAAPCANDDASSVGRYFATVAH
ncbi:MAG TPA: hypothetical protein VLT33_27160, partial [Labilithrix sp.]|nr:hypothetical protein [Labilithrix sp.]